MRAVTSADAVPFVVGGDHSVALPALRAVAARQGPLAVVHVDAHLDTSGPETWGEAFHHGTPFRHALDEGLVAPGQLHQVGIRGPWGDPRDAEHGAAHGAHVHTADDVADRGETRAGTRAPAPVTAACRARDGGVSGGAST